MSDRNHRLVNYAYGEKSVKLSSVRSTSARTETARPPTSAKGRRSRASSPAIWLSARAWIRLVHRQQASAGSVRRSDPRIRPDAVFVVRHALGGNQRRMASSAWRARSSGGVRWASSISSRRSTSIGLEFTTLLAGPYRANARTWAQLVGLSAGAVLAAGAGAAAT